MIKFMLVHVPEFVSVDSNSSSPHKAACESMLDILISCSNNCAHIPVNVIHSEDSHTAIM